MQDRDAKLVAYWQRGFRPNYIAKMLDMTQQHVYTRAHQLGLPPRGAPPPASPSRFSTAFWDQFSLALSAVRRDQDLTDGEREAMRVLLALARRKMPPHRPGLESGRAVRRDLEQRVDEQGEQPGDEQADAEGGGPRQAAPDQDRQPRDRDDDAKALQAHLPGLYIPNGIKGPARETK